MHRRPPAAVEDAIRLRVDHLLERSRLASGERQEVAREWRAHLAEAWEAWVRQGHDDMEAVDLACEGFGDAASLRVPMARLHWRRDLSWSLLGVPRLVWLWVFAEIAAMQMLWPGARPSTGAWVALLLLLAAVLTGLVLLLRLAVARLRRGAGDRRQRLICFVATALPAWILIVAVRVAALEARLGAAREPFFWTAGLVAALLAAVPIVWLRMRETGDPAGIAR